MPLGRRVMVPPFKKVKFKGEKVAHRLLYFTYLTLLSAYLHVLSSHYF